MADMLTNRLSRWIKGVSVKTVNFIAPEEETSSATDRASKVSYPRMASIKSVEDAMPGQMTSDSLAKAIKKRKEAENSLGDFVTKPDAEINPHHIVSDLGRAIGMTRNAPSLYRSYTADDGSIFSIRLSNHRANADNYVDKKNAAKVNISIAVIRDRSGEFKPNDTVELREYEYNESDLTVDDVKKIAQSLRDAIANGGVYADTTGKLIIENTSPSNVRNSIEKIYTGSTADYANRSRQGGIDDGPSLHKIGTGEGTQNEAWGLYGTNAPGIAGRYANQDVYLLPKILYRNGREIPNKQYDFLESAQSTYESMRLKKGSHEKTMEVLRQNLESRAEDRMNRLEIDRRL
jgi:hypothetical protein